MLRNRIYLYDNDEVSRLLSYDTKKVDLLLEIDFKAFVQEKHLFSLITKTLLRL